MSFDFSGLGLTELIRLREQLSSEISRRFEKKVAIHQNAQVRLGGVMTLVFFFVDTSGQFGETALR